MDGFCDDIPDLNEASLLQAVGVDLVGVITDLLVMPCQLLSCSIVSRQCRHCGHGQGLSWKTLRVTDIPDSKSGSLGLDELEPSGPIFI